MSAKIEKAGVHRVFDAIASTYDRVNRILSFGIDCYWRKQLLPHLPKAPLKWLDLATGTGDQIFALLGRHPVDTVIGMDLSTEMLAIGARKSRRRELSDIVSFCEGDAQKIPLDDKSINCITMSFGIRNVPDPLKCLQEMHRVLKSNGRALILEFSLPRNRMVRKLHLFYLRKVLPAIGGLISRNKEAYSYLNETIESFPYGNDFCRLIEEASFNRVKHHPLTFGIATLYVAEKC